MASSARGRESCRNVVRTVGGLVLRLVTAEAVGGHAGVVVVDVTASTRDGGVLPRQRKRCVVVVEACRTPGCRTVAHLALLRESGRNVTWIVRALEILQMAAYAGGVCDVVVRIGMTLAALQS